MSQEIAALISAALPTQSTAVGPAATTLTITTDNPAPSKHTLHVPLSGSGAPGHLATNIPTLNNNTLAFGSVSHTGPPKTLSFKIKNIGKGDLQGNVPSLSAPFSLTVGGGAFDLLPGQLPQTITVQFPPTTSTPPLSVPLVITVMPPGKPAARITVTVKGKGT